MESNSEKDKPWKEQLGSFLKEPTRLNLLRLLQLEAVEDNDLEFKRELLPFDLLAKHILAMSNKQGGAIVFGVEEKQANQFSPCGLSSSVDITDIEKKLSNYIPKKLNPNIFPFYFGGEEQPEYKDKFFLVVVVNYNPRYIPFVSLKAGDNIKKDIIYIRRNRASEPINHDELQEILNNRIDTEYSATDERKLIEHLEELKELYSHIPKTVKQIVSYPHTAIIDLQNELRRLNGEPQYKTVPNPDYPQESYENFVGKLIEIKKDIIIQSIKKS
jgi:predicted HTH transcriptional regulator